MGDFITVLFIVAMFGIAFWSIRKLFHFFCMNKTSHSNSTYIGSQSENKYGAYVEQPPVGISYIDSQNLPPHFSYEERKYLLEVANSCGKRYITQQDMKNFTTQNIAAEFLAMPGWDVWDSSIHKANGQYERMERAVMDKGITVLSYDPQYRLAKVQGRMGVYLTCYKRCSCPDYRKRRLPCKHMYALAMELDGDINRCILDTDHAPLYGLTLALAGHLPKSNNGVGGIRAEITAKGGIWSDAIEMDSSAVVMGKNPSLARQSRAGDLDMEVLTPEQISDIFTVKENGAESHGQAQETNL